MWKKTTLSTCAFTAPPADEAALTRQFEMAREAGFDGFEVAMVPVDTTKIICRAIKKSQANIVAVHGILDANSCSPDPALRERSVERAYRYLSDFAEYAPCPFVEHYFNRFNDPEPGKFFRDTVEKLLERTEKDGFIFCMENAPTNRNMMNASPRWRKSWNLSVHSAKTECL